MGIGGPIWEVVVMNYYKKIAVSKALGVAPGEMFIMSELGEDCIFRLREYGLEVRIGTRWYPSTQMEFILNGSLGDILSLRGA